MAVSIEERGYRQTTVADVVRIARTSRRSFYEHFEDREACFLALFDESNEAIMEQIAASTDPERHWEEQVDAALAVFLDLVSTRPALSRSFVRELPALGQAGAERGRAVIERFARLLVGLVESGRRGHPELRTQPLTMDMALMIAGGLRELIIMSAEQGRDVRELHPAAGKSIKAILHATVLQAGDRSSGG